MPKEYSEILNAVYLISVETEDKANTQARVGGALIDLTEKSAAVENAKVDKVAGKQLSTEDYTTAEKTKLGGIATGANLYTHPANHAPSIITQDSNNRFVTDTEKSTWNNKQDSLGYVPENLTNKNAANGYAGLDSNGKLAASQLPAIAITDTFVVSSEAAMLALTAQVGDICIRTDVNKTYILKTDGATTLANWALFLTPTDAVTSVAGKIGIVTLVKSDVGLGNVDNTADASKAVLSATKLTNSRTINGVSFDGTANISIYDSTKEPIITAGTTGDYYRGDKTWQPLNKSSVGLGNVNNTADADKPVSTATQTALNGKANASHTHTPANITQDAGNRFVTDIEKAAWNAKQAALGYTAENTANKGVANGYCGLGSDGKINSTFLPAIAITNTFVCNSQAEMLALTAETGDVCARSDVSLTYILQGTDPSILSHWQQILAPTGTTGLVQSVNGMVGVVVIEKNHIGLENVDNTSDVNKPISTATQTALNNKVDKVAGKQLSTEDFSTVLKAKLDEIEAGAQANVNPDWNAVSGSAQILNKPNITDLSRKTLVANLASASYFKFAETAINPRGYMGHFRITVNSSTTTIGQILDVWVMGHGENAPLSYVMSNTKSTTAATTGIYYLRFIYPKTLDNGYNVQFELAANNTTSRDITVELIESSNVTLLDSLVASAPNATYQTTGTAQVVGYDGFISQGTLYGSVSGSAGSAPLVSCPYTSYTAGIAMVANDLIALGSDLKWYKVSNADVSIPIGTVIASCGSTYALNAAVSTSYILGNRTLQTGTAGTKNTGRDLYIRGQVTGQTLVTDGTITTELEAGYSYIRIGALITATTAYLDGNNRLVTIGTDTLMEKFDGYGFNATKVNGFTVEKAVPSDALFTDTVYTHPETHSADILTNGIINKVFSSTDKTKLDGIAEGAEVNVNPDWGAISGKAQILNKPTSLAGYGILDVYTKTEVDNLLNNKESSIAAGTTAQYFRGDKTWQTLNKTAVGLGNVDNTSDASKPISTATQTALNGKAATSHTHSSSDLSDTVPVAKGGTGLAALGTAKQLLQVNGAGNALEWTTPRDKGVNTASTLASLPVTKRLVYATVTAATSLSLAASMEIGDELHILVYNNSASAITQAIPNTGSYISMSGASISIPAAGWVEINIICHATDSYIIRAGGAA